MSGIKRSSRRLGKVLGHRAGLNGERLLSYLDARKLIYLPCYHWVLEHALSQEIAELRKVALERPVILLDYETNSDILDLSRPLSHATLIKRYLENGWPD